VNKNLRQTIMKSSTDIESHVTMPLTLEAHHLAQKFYRQHPKANIAKRVYLNTLAIYAVHTYLKALGIESQLAAGDSWNRSLQALSDTADLVVSGKGKLECRPLLPNEDALLIPPEVQNNRIGYVAVHLDSSLREATLLGFVMATHTESIPIEKLLPLEKLLMSLSETPVKIGNWLTGIFDDEWQAISELWLAKSLTWQFRNTTMGIEPVIRYRVVTIEQVNHHPTLALIVGIAPTQTRERDIWIRVCSTTEYTYLPVNLEVKILDSAGTAVMQAQARETEAIQLKFGGQPLEKFSVQMLLGDHSQIETFVI
jgi:hypothetical protein